MSFFDDVWDGVLAGIDIVTGDEDALYPDNAKRKRRVEELYNDVKNFQHEAAQLKSETESELNNLDESLKNFTIFERYDFKTWSIKAPLALREVIQIESIYNALTMAGIFSIKDRSQQEKLIEFSDLPFDMKLIKVNGIPILPIGGLVGGAIAGAELRDKLRQSTEELILVRIKIKQYNMILTDFNKKLAQLGDKDTLKEFGYDEKIIDELLGKKIADIKNTAIATTEITAKQALEKLDNGRSSWTVEG